MLAGLGNLLIEAAEWLSAFLPMPLTDESYGAADDTVSLSLPRSPPIEVSKFLWQVHSVFHQPPVKCIYQMSASCCKELGFKPAACLRLLLTEVCSRPQVGGMLGNALQLMSEVGEEIGELIPDQRLNSGDTIEVVFGVSLCSVR